MKMSPFGVGRDGEPYRGYVPAVLVFLLALLSAETAGAQSADPNRFLEWSYRDGAAMLDQLPAQAPGLALGGAALLFPMATLDEPVLHGIQRGNRGAVDDYLDFVNPIGGPKAMPAAAGIFAATLLTNDTHLQDAAFTSLQSILYAGTAVYSLKYTFGRFRPETGADVREFDMFSGNTSFPSGHTATAFALVTPWVMYYPGPITYGLMALPVGTAVARIAKDRHWPTDVIAGAAIGYMTARFLSNRHMDQQRADQPRVEVTPTVAPGAVGVHMRVGLD